MKKLFLILCIPFSLFSNSILVVGSGGREHALAWKLAQSKHVNHVYVAPGNAGTALEDKVSNVNIAVTDTQKLIEFCKEKEIVLTIVGPEVPLEHGIVDAFQKEKLLCFGPTQKAAQIECCRQFAKDLMKEHNISTAAYHVFTEYESALHHITTETYPLVLKADGLAAGKGVIIAQNTKEAENALKQYFIAKKFGDAGNKIIIEEFLEGQEISFMVVSNGHVTIPLTTSQDYKKRDDGECGPNTGGMGSISPSPHITPELEQQIMNSIIYPTINALKEKGILYTGVLYAGLMLTKDGPKVIEFNCRLGDPETQSILSRLDSDLFELCAATVTEHLFTINLKWKDEKAVTVMVASGGYPEKYTKGYAITGLDETDVKLFHSGTTLKDNKIVTSGGRVIAATALGKTYKEAQEKAYQKIDTLSFKDRYYRTDIGLVSK